MRLFVLCVLWRSWHIYRRVSVEGKCHNRGQIAIGGLFVVVTKRCCSSSVMWRKRALLSLGLATFGMGDSGEGTPLFGRDVKGMGARRP